MKKVNSINIEKFKSVFVSINFLTSIDAKNMSKNALLASVMKKGNKTYNTEKEINRKLAKMYDALIDVSTEKYKDYINLKVQFEFINVESIEKLNKKEIIELLIDYITNPKIINDSFDKTIVEREKAGLIEKINEEKDNKRRYALARLDEIMFENEEYATSTLGREKDIQEIDEKGLYKYYLELMNNSSIIVNVAGNLKGYEMLGSELYNEVLNKLNRENIKDILYREEQNNIRTEIKEQVEHQQISQSVVAIGIKIDNVTQKDSYKIMVYNQILGGNPASLMFQNVREKHSLAYFAKSIYNRQKQTISIFAGIEPKKIDKAKTIMLEQLNIMQNGEFSETQFKASKDTLISAYKESFDVKEELSKLMFTNEMYFGKLVTIDEMIEEIEKVTKQDVLEIAEKVRLDSIFCLGGEEING